MAHRTAAAALVSCAALLAVTGCSSGFDSDEKTQQDSSSKQNLKILIASSGDAETKAVQDAVAAYEKASGNKVTVDVAKDINQQLAQSFAGHKPPDAFYVNSDQFANYAKGGSLYAYGDKVSDADDFNEGLRQSFTYDGKLTCLPKDVSTLALAINTDLWKKAGLTDKDYPTSWAELKKVADKLTGKGTTGLVVGAEYARLGVFLKEAGGWITDPDQSKMTADSSENVEALTYVKSLLKSGSLKYAAQVDTGWGGEALGKGKAAMTIEGSWLTGAMKTDYPDTGYTAVPLPAGPGGKGTLAFSQCWGVAAESTHQSAAVDLVKYLTSAKQQLANADAFGVLPSRTSAQTELAKKDPSAKVWLDANAYAQGPVTVAGFDKVLGQFNTDLAALASTDPKTVLGNLQRNGEQALTKAKDN
ncbi:extracellular solute-binding protein [Streptomyces griseoviridis]|uniref:ABC transporter substrate-binding protein n=2 Tax=Streptomyces TaxID=1883 RepID=A0A3S9ZG01_STRGD|nr:MULTISPECIES: extracellular solute-binding protein [Streptomyces]AZS86686.1 extracellular solute-binding protein [Streptomyces griseoviridis]MDT0471061.1 extracellular solute-binding protein [Streptomyces sp. DSM 41014]QCN86451.1 ABC transporter substrate-binding protein [Streptomyces griseoviridis]